MNKLLVLSVFSVGLLSLSAVAGGPWYVAKEDPNASDAPVAGRGTEALPFRTIQAALDNEAFDAGDTVYVKRGDYDEGMKVSSGSWPMTNRVWITKTVHLIAKDGKDVTRILGFSSSDPAATADGLGPDSVRCVGVASAATGTTIEGFTLQGGRTTNTSNSNRAYRQGGGILYYGTDCNMTAIDCVFRDCVAPYGGAALGITAIRCLIDNCSGSVGAMFDGGRAYSCVFKNCAHRMSDSGSYDAMIGAYNGSLIAVNCTFFGNSGMNLFQASGKTGSGCTYEVYNCVLANNSAEAARAATVSDSTDTTTAAEKAYQIFAPGFNDFRLVENATAIGLGKVANVQKLKELGVDETYLKKDFLGNVVDLTGDTLNAGAVQAVATPATALIEFADSATVNGTPIVAGEWVASETYPCQFLVSPVVPEGKTFYAYVRPVVSGSTEPAFVYLQPDGQVRITPPPAAVLATQTYTAKYAAAEIWADPTAAEGGDGSEEAPFRKLQDAVDAVTVDYTLIRAKPGDYKEGGRAWSNLFARVDLYTEGRDAFNILLRAEEGPANTAIWGAADNEGTDANEPGCGPNAVRCVLMNNLSAIQGFTLRDGHTFPSSVETVPSGGATSDYRKNGAAVYALLNNRTQPYQLLDCVITNCVGSKSILFWGFTQRNRIVGNTTSGMVEHRGWHSAELVMGNTCGGYGTDTGYYYHSTFVGNAKSPAVDYFVNFYAGEYVYNCIFIGGNCVRTMKADSCNFYWNQSSYANMSADSTKADPLLVNAAQGDCRPFVYSPVIGACTNVAYKYVGSDLTYGPMRIAADGKMSAGCFQNNLPSAVVFSDRAGNVETNAVEAGNALTRGIPSATHPNWQKGTATLQEGTALDVDWTAAGSLRKFAATVEGAGTLSVLLNGEVLGTVTAADGKKPFSFKPSDTGDTVRFAYAGEGSATLADFKSGAGLMLIVR